METNYLPTTISWFRLPEYVKQLRTDVDAITVGIPEAPIDGSTYGRKNGAWTIILGDSHEGHFESGTRAGGDLITIIGDHDISNNGYRMRIDDNNQIINIGAAGGGIRIQEGYYAYNGGGVIIGDVDNTNGQSRLEVNLTSNGRIESFGNHSFIGGAQFYSGQTTFHQGGQPSRFITIGTTDLAGGSHLQELTDHSGKLPVITTTAVPATDSSEGIKGEIRYDSSHVYICTANNTWIRAALTAAW